MAVDPVARDNVCPGMSRSSPLWGDSDSTTTRYARLLEVQTLMARVSREIGPALDLERVLKTVLEAVRDLVDCDGGLIWLVEDQYLTVAAVTPEPDEAIPPARLDGPERTLAETVLATGVSARSDDFVHDERVTPSVRERARQRGLASYLCVPLVCLGDVIGTLAVASSEKAAFDDEHQLLLEGLATQVAGAIESARRYEMVTELEVLKSDFIARVSHELRTPITIMSGFVGTLLTNHEELDDETRHRMLERVDVATARLSGLIDQLLMLSRLEAGVVAATIEPVAADLVFEEVRRQAIMPEAIEIVCPEGLRLVTDRALLVRGLGLLVDNSLKYAGSCRIEASMAAIEVLDDGPGIPVRERSRVFERFTRANQDTTVPGMGIGLPMARTLLAAAGAELRIEETVDGVGCRMVARWM